MEDPFEDFGEILNSKLSGGDQRHFSVSLQRPQTATSQRRAQQLDKLRGAGEENEQLETLSEVSEELSVNWRDQSEENAAILPTNTATKQPTNIDTWSPNISDRDEAEEGQEEEELADVEEEEEEEEEESQTAVVKFASELQDSSEEEFEHEDDDDDDDEEEDKKKDKKVELEVESRLSARETRLNGPAVGGGRKRRSDIVLDAVGAEANLIKEKLRVELEGEREKGEQVLLGGGKGKSGLFDGELMEEWRKLKREANKKQDQTNLDGQINNDDSGNPSLNVFLSTKLATNQHVDESSNEKKETEEVVEDGRNRGTSELERSIRNSLLRLLADDSQLALPTLEKKLHKNRNNRDDDEDSENQGKHCNDCNISREDLKEAHNKEKKEKKNRASPSSSSSSSSSALLNQGNEPREERPYNNKLRGEIEELKGSELEGGEFQGLLDYYEKRLRKFDGLILINSMEFASHRNDISSNRFPLATMEHEAAFKDNLKQSTDTFGGQFEPVESNLGKVIKKVEQHQLRVLHESIKFKTKANSLLTSIRLASGRLERSIETHKSGISLF